MPYKTMRDIFIERVYQRIKEDRNIFFLSADFGAPKLDELRKDFQDRFINVGIAEQNLINVATGLALEGFTVFAYGIAPFLTMRAYEQIRVNLSMLSQLRPVNVNFVGVGAGISYVVSGPTHHCLEDLGIIRMLPGIELFSPSDNILVAKFIDQSLNRKTPKYLRLDGAPLPDLYGQHPNLALADGFCELAKGEEFCVAATGYMTHKALRVRENLKQNSVQAGVVDVFSLRPLAEEKLFQTLNKYKAVLTLEEGFVGKGGLDALVSSLLNKYNSAVKVRSLGFGDKFVFEIGSREYLHQLNKLDEETIAQAIEGYF